MNRFVKLLLAVFFLGLSSTYAHFSQQAQREGEAQAVLILNLVRRGLYPQAATQINDLVKKQFNPKFRFDYQTFDTAYISKKIPLPLYQNYVRTPETPLTKPTSYFLFILDSYFKRAKVLTNPRQYIDFFVNVVLENPESRANIGTVLDTLMYRFPGADGERMVADLIVKHFQTHPDSNMFWNIDPFNRSILNNLPLELQIKMLTSYLGMDHRFVLGREYSYHYEIILMKYKSLVSKESYLDFISGLISQHNKERFLQSFADRAVSVLISEFIKEGKTSENAKIRFKALFNNDFFKSGLFNLINRGDIIPRMKAFVNDLYVVDKELAAIAVKEFLIRTPQYLDNEDVMKDLIRPYIIKFTDNVHENKYLRYISTSLNTPLGSACEKKRHELFKLYYAEKKPLPVDPKVIVPVFGVHSAPSCHQFYGAR